MKAKLALILLLCPSFIILTLQISNAQVKKGADFQFRISRTGLEATDYKKIVLLTELEEYYDENLGSGQIGLTEAMVRKECESHLEGAGLEPVSKFVRPEYLSVKVNIKHRSYFVAIQFNRPVSYQLEETQLTKYGAMMWQKIYLGQHGYAPEYILESVKALIGEFTNEYLRANLK